MLAGRGHRGQQCPTAGDRTVRGGVGGVVVGPDQPCPAADRRGRPGEGIEVEGAVEADQHDVRRPVLDHRGSALLQRLHDAGPTDHQRPVARIDESGRSHGRAEHVALGRNTDVGQRGFDVLPTQVRVVGDEEHSPAGGPEPFDGLGGTGDGMVGQPHHPVEIADHRWC